MLFVDNDIIVKTPEWLQKFARYVSLYHKMFVGFEDFELCIRAILARNPVKARLIHDIEFIHNHCQAKKNEDKNAILIRYDFNLIENSFNRIIEKHNIILESNWKNWVANQVKKTLKKHTFTFNIDWKRWIPISLKRLLSRENK